MPGDNLLHVLLSESKSKLNLANILITKFSCIKMSPWPCHEAEWVFKFKLINFTSTVAIITNLHRTNNVNLRRNGFILWQAMSLIIRFVQIVKIYTFKWRWHCRFRIWNCQYDKLYNCGLFGSDSHTDWSLNPTAICSTSYCTSCTVIQFY